MDAWYFDCLTRTLNEAGPRRRLLGLVTAVVLGGLLPHVDPEAATAKGKPPGQRRSHRPGKDKDNRKGKRKDQDQGQVQTQDCPDGIVSCYLVDANDDNCTLVSTFPPIGHCYEFLTGCCPCAHRDQAYWTDQCNQLVPECNGNCRAGDQAGSFTCFNCGGNIL